jgi:peptidoglycan/xylan/chitin deacetylase (PgdA/CDA1 family)
MSEATPILLFHRVGPPDGSAMDRYTVSPARFALQMAQLAAEGWRGVALEDFLDSDMPPAAGRQVAVTFDDGFASNRKHAWPVLAQHRFRATTFLVAGEIGGVNSWDGAAMPRFPLLGAADLREADPGTMSFQSHGATHRPLPSMGAADLEREIRDSRIRLEAAIGRPVNVFAYPFGAWDRRVRDAVAGAGYRAACSCESGRNGPRDDPFLLRRVEILEEDLGWRLRLKLLTGRHLERLAQPDSWRSAMGAMLRPRY